MQSRSGFTIIELLIVIVVMGILAAIIVVVFTGIQDRARNAKLLGGIDTVEKGLRMYAAKNGHFPEPTDSGGQYACVQPTGNGWQAKDGLTASQCFVGDGLEVEYSAILHDELLTTMSSIPDTRDMTLAIQSDASSRGIIYTYSLSPGVVPQYPNGLAGLQYFIRGDQVCGRGYKGTSMGFTSCIVVLQ